ncbi:suppressor of fused domain protein [Nocardia sp. NPDC059177]|uniref:suppressor of fused domain protein n=1 Tax=Nocardia sp. NPDC059177 TaxID=3346759 RepID=UPI0036BBFDE5
MSADENFSGLLEHLEQRLGPVRRVESAQTEAGNRGYDLTFYEVEDPPVTTVVTNGVRFQQIRSMLPEEFLCMLRSDQAHIAQHLVDSIASMAIRSQRGMEYGTVFRNKKPIITGTEIVGVVAHVNPKFDDTFNLFPNATAPRLQIVTLVPVTGYELDFVKEEGADKLFEVFWLNRTNILDVHRQSAV